MKYVVCLIFAISFSSATPIIPISPEQCSRGNRIVNGWRAELNQIPWQCRVLMPVSTGFAVCGCVVLKENVIITAAHCTWTRHQFILGFGMIKVDEPLTQIESTNKREHPDYNGKSIDHDISLIYLPIRLSWNDAIKPAILPTRAQESELFIGEKLQISGFGYIDEAETTSEYLHYTYVKGISNQDCNEVYGHIQEGTLCCRGWDFTAQSICPGDSGSALIYENSTIVGVASFVSNRGCESGDPSGYVRVTYYLDWIAENADIEIAPVNVL